MRILDRYIVREVFRHALLGLAVFTFVFFVPQLVRLMELFVRHSGSGAQILELFLCIFPAVFTFTMPMAVLIGVLLGLGRMSADSEIIALTALGIGRRRILLPVGVLAAAGAVITLCMTLWLGPLAVRKYRTLETGLIASQISFAVQPRVFDERFPKYILYVNDVSASGTRWHGVFLAEAGGESGSQLTLAEDAIVIAEPKEGKLELHLKGGTTHEFSREDPDRYSVTAFGQSDWPIEVNGLVPAQPRRVSNSERSLRDLAATNDAGWREARVELHRRLAFPAACLVFALVAVPLRARRRVADCGHPHRGVLPAHGDWSGHGSPGAALSFSWDMGRQYSDGSSGSFAPSPHGTVPRGKPLAQAHGPIPDLGQGASTQEIAGSGCGCSSLCSQ
jgi:LPS export ABC transporter permease LptF